MIHKRNSVILLATTRGFQDQAGSEGMLRTELVKILVERFGWLEPLLNAGVLKGDGKGRNLRLYLASKV